MTEQFCTILGITDKGKYSIFTKIEEAKEQENRKLIGVRFDLREDGRTNAISTVGTVGNGSTHDEALADAIDDWLAYFSPVGFPDDNVVAGECRINGIISNQLLGELIKT